MHSTVGPTSIFKKTKSPTCSGFLLQWPLPQHIFKHRPLGALATMAYKVLRYDGAFAELALPLCGVSFPAPPRDTVLYPRRKKTDLQSWQSLFSKEEVVSLKRMEGYTSSKPQYPRDPLLLEVSKTSFLPGPLKLYSVSTQSLSCSPSGDENDHGPKLRYSLRK